MTARVALQLVSLTPGLVEDHPLQPADDVAGLLQLGLGLDVEVDRVPAAGTSGSRCQSVGVDLHHVVDAGVVAVAHLGQPEVRALAGVAGHDVVDHGAAVLGGDRAHGAELVLGAERRVDLHADPVEVAVDARRSGPSR